MRVSIDHHGIEFDVSYSYRDGNPRPGGPPPLDPPEAEEYLDVLTYELTDRDEWGAWHEGEEPTAERLKAFVKEARADLLEDARSRFASGRAHEGMAFR